jgi:hypothetical protein
MREIKGIKLSSFPFPGSKKVGDLTYFDGPIMSLFQTGEGANLIYDWVDRDSEHHRWLIYEVEDFQLANYVRKKLSHFDLINTCLNNIVFAVDYNFEIKPGNVLVTSVSEIPYEYFPNRDVYFDEEECPEYELLAKVLKYDSRIDVATIPKIDIIEESKISKSELFNIHLKNGSRGVRYGKVSDAVLGNILVDVHQLNENIALDIFRDKKTIFFDNYKKKGRRVTIDEIKELVSQEWSYSKAASFSIFLKPIYSQSQLALFSESTPVQEVFKHFMTLVNAGDTPEELNKIKSKYSDEVLGSLKKLLDHIKELDLDVEFRWGNFLSNLKLDERIDAKRATEVSKNLDELEFTNEQNFDVFGKFRALDAISLSFKFDSSDNLHFEGKFSEGTRNLVSTLNLKDFYNVRITRMHMKRARQKKLINKDKLIHVKGAELNLEGEAET